MNVTVAKAHHDNFDMDIKLPVRVRGEEHPCRLAFRAKLSSVPGVNAAFLVPRPLASGEVVGVAELRYGEFAGCCPIDPIQRLMLFVSKPAVQVKGPAELRIGPDFVALVRGKVRSPSTDALRLWPRQKTRPWRRLAAFRHSLQKGRSASDRSLRQPLVAFTTDH